MPKEIKAPKALSKKRHFIAYEITYQATILDKIGKLMSTLDLGIDGIYAPTVATCSWNTSQKPTPQYFKKMEKALRLAMENSEKRIINLKRIAPKNDEKRKTPKNIKRNRPRSGHK